MHPLAHLRKAMLSCFRREVHKLEQVMKRVTLANTNGSPAHNSRYHRYAIPFFQPSVNQSSHPACKRKPRAHNGLIILFQVSLAKGSGPRVHVVPAEPSIDVSLPLLSGWNMGSSFPLDKNSRGVSSELLANILHTPRRMPIHTTRKIKAFITAGL